MKENQNPNIKKQTLKKEHKITLFLQFFVFFVMIVLGISYLFYQNILSYLLVSAILFLWLGAYNSYRYLGKKKMPILYILASLLFILQLVGF